MSIDLLQDDGVAVITINRHVEQRMSRREPQREGVVVPGVAIDDDGDAHAARLHSVRPAAASTASRGA